MSEQYGFITEEAVVKEMTSDGLGIIDVPVEEGLITKLAEGDDDPMFVTIEVINEGVSRNGRAYNKESIESLAEQINSKKPNGYYGHLTDDERKTKYPEPQTIWIGAKVEEVGGKTRLFAKGYVLPEAKSLRSYLKKAKLVGKNVAVSVYGMAQVVKDSVRNIQLVKSMQLESIDWARPGSEGVLNMGLFSVASEMIDSNLKHEQGATMDKAEILQTATIEDLREANPTIVQEMVEEITEQAEAVFDKVVSEMAEVRHSLDIDEDVSAVETIKEMAGQLQDYKLDEQLKDKVENPASRKVIKQLVISEMYDGTSVDEAVNKVLSSETGQAIIVEMLEVAPKVAPMTAQPVVVARKFTKKG